MIVCTCIMIVYTLYYDSMHMYYDMITHCIMIVNTLCYDSIRMTYYDSIHMYYDMITKPYHLNPELTWF